MHDLDQVYSELLYKFLIVLLVCVRIFHVREGSSNFPCCTLLYMLYVRVQNLFLAEKEKWTNFFLDREEFVFLREGEECRIALSQQ